MISTYNLSGELREEAHRILEVSQSFAFIPRSVPEVFCSSHQPNPRTCQSVQPGHEFAATIAYIAICTSLLTDHSRLQRANQPWVPTDPLRVSILYFSCLSLPLISFTITNHELHHPPGARETPWGHHNVGPACGGLWGCARFQSAGDRVLL